MFAGEQEVDQRFRFPEVERSARAEPWRKCKKFSFAIECQTSYAPLRRVELHHDVHLARIGIAKLLQAAFDDFGEIVVAGQVALKTPTWHCRPPHFPGFTVAPPFVPGALQNEVPGCRESTNGKNGLGGSLAQSL